MPRPWTMRRSLLTALAVVCGATATFGVLAAPAQASMTQARSCVDGGGTRWNVKAVWGGTYQSADGVTRVRLDYAGWTTPRADTVPTHARIRSYDGAGTPVQDRRWRGSVDYARGTVFRAVNPLNPPSAPGRTRLRLTVGVAGDGKSSCSVNLLQPTVSTPTPSPSTPAPPTPTTSPSDRYENDVLAGTNAERSRAGLVPLSAQACVDSYAEAQAQKMAAEGRMYHQDLLPVLSGCRLSTVGENVAYGYRDGAAVMAGWMGSPGHKANILKPEYRLLGVGAAQDARGVWYAAQVFGTLR